MAMEKKPNGPKPGIKKPQPKKPGIEKGKPGERIDVSPGTQIEKGKSGFIKRGQKGKAEPKKNE